MKGILYAAIGGSLITLQGVFNAKLGLDIGIWSTSTITHFIGFIVALLIALSTKEPLSNVKKAKSFYLVGGTFGSIIVFSEIFSIQLLGVTLTAVVLMIAQLLSAFFVELIGVFEVKKIKLETRHIIGISFICLGFIVFNL